MDLLKMLFLPALCGLVCFCSLPGSAAAAGRVTDISSAAKEVHDIWRSTVMQARPQAFGCFHAAYPARVWEQVACLPAASIPSARSSLFPMPSKEVPAATAQTNNGTAGNGNDYVIVSAGFISEAVGSFPSVTGLTGESGVGAKGFDYKGILGQNEYSLQINSQSHKTTAACQGHPGCTVWQQFIYSTDYSTLGHGDLYIQYWLNGYGRPCPANWWSSGEKNCYVNSNLVPLPNLPPAQLDQMSLKAAVEAGGNDTAMLAVGTEVYAVNAPDSVLDLATIWDAAEFNVFGDAGGSEAVFNTGTSLTVNLAVTDGAADAPACAGHVGSTGEGNNLFLGECTVQGGTTPSIQFTESNVGSTLLDTTTTLASSANPGIAGTSVVGLSATVVGNNPTGAVVFSRPNYGVLCVANLQLVNGRNQAYCSLAAGGDELPAGSRYVVAAYEGNGNNQPSASSMLTQTVTAAEPFNPDQFGLSGAWYNPATSGQGLVLTVYPDNIGTGKALVAGGYFGFSPTGRDWFAIQGEADANAAKAKLTLYAASGSGALNAPPAISSAAVGTATLVFGDCGHMALEYHFNPTGGYASFGNGAIPLQKLDADVSCSAKGDTGTAATTSWGYTGAWYAPSTSGQGFYFDVNPNQSLLFGAWYTYQPNGNRDWYTLQANFPADATSAEAVPVYMATGGAFNTPTTITTSQIGTANVSFTSCTTMTMSYSLTAGPNAGASGTISQVRLGPPPMQCR